MIHSKAALFFLIGFWLIYFPGTARADAQHKVEGHVFDKDNKALHGVLVRAYRNVHEKIDGEDRTKENGKYLIEFDSGSPITVRYDHTDYHIGRVNDICGSINHNISKVLFSIDEELSDDQKQNLTSTLRQIYFIDKANGISDQRYFSRYAKSISILSIDMLVKFPFKAYEVPNIKISEGNENIFCTAGSIGSFNTFLGLVKAANYEDILKYKSPITVLAPTDEAFKKLPERYIADLKKPANKYSLRSFLNNYIISGALDFAKIKEIGLEKKYCGIEIIYPDIKAKNGIIHAIDKVELQ